MPAPQTSLEDMTHEELLAYASSVRPVADLASTLLADPDARAAVQREYKRLNPAARIPELEQRESIEARFAAEREEREKLRNQLLERDARDRIERERKAIRDQYGFDDADVAAVEALMTDKDDPIPSYKAAARVHAASKASAQPTTSALKPPVYDMPDKGVWGAGINNPAMLNRIGVEQAFAALNELREGKVAGA